MAPNRVSVAIPVRNGGALLAEVLSAVRAQQLDTELELLVADSGSVDGSGQLAAAMGARVLEVEPGEFSHGGTRNLLLEESSGSHVAFLTQDSMPADPHWLARLLDAFRLADDLALAFGPYRARADASLMVRRELEQWFRSFAPDGVPRVDRAPHVGLAGATGRRAAFFTDANGCVARTAWEGVPFRDVSYAEDQLLAHDMLRAGWAKAYHPAAAVIHSHDYTPFRVLQRSFDEWRGLREVCGQEADGHPVEIALAVQRDVRDDMRFRREEGEEGRPSAGAVLRSVAHHAARRTGAALGSRADRLSPRVRRALSLERRGGFDPVDAVEAPLSEVTRP